MLINFNFGEDEINHVYIICIRVVIVISDRII